ncbi:hypothetical protein KKF73_04725, partial [Patescibacteria group bacterium]|nr:hypothetical protein [Patescibacteria group bacterium]
MPEILHDADEIRVGLYLDQIEGMGIRGMRRQIARLFTDVQVTTSNHTELVFTGNGNLNVCTATNRGIVIMTPTKESVSASFDMTREVIVDGRQIWISQNEDGKSVPYEGEAPPLIEYDEDEETCTAEQGSGAVSFHGESLLSKRFCQCYPVVLQKSESFPAALLHIDSIQLNSRELSAIEMLQQREIGDPTTARIIKGFCSENAAAKVIKGQLERMGIEVLDDIQVDTEYNEWDVIYRPTSRVILVNLRGD